MFFLSGAFFPLHGVPLWMQWLADIDPVTYGVDPLRQVALRASVPVQLLDTLRLHSITIDVAVMVVFGLVFIIPAVWLFSKTE
jgi:ABC-2 type transport system permease protein